MSNVEIADKVREILTTKQVAEEYGFEEATLRWWRHCSTGPASFKLGKRVVYRRSALDAWIEAQEAATTRGGVA